MVGMRATVENVASSTAFLREMQNIVNRELSANFNMLDGLSTEICFPEYYDDEQIYIPVYLIV